ncbi:hypothetical protein XJ44_02925 [Thermosipho affectus]|uniref:Prepilin-type N-terminal cleavage/methylation domain-containing protein n=1 Tax=Thermosipho affectus TaxID=660294 RepID=A0ABX3IJX5_9BACT|nr:MULTISPECIES: type II secretion system protein [Thermosipho]ANQ54574.1 hypothetical protein Y592_03000 [Thermosipho sp. 1070]APT73007.1 hypothetical protein BG95_02990 [Thermosipho sp. 1063]ONN27589.1 hypothetical protein XJ44_02925 [Thermosipho affectus]OOC44857.1 hypothetical protein XO08_02960 [Thermosipho sp. 1074]
MKKGFSLTETLVSLLLIALISTGVFSLVSFSSFQNGKLKFQNKLSNFKQFVVNEILIRGVKDKSIESLPNILNKKFYGTQDPNIYPKLSRIKVEKVYKSSNIVIARILKVTILKTANKTEEFLIFQGRP